jgi:hypothetical protein
VAVRRVRPNVTGRLDSLVGRCGAHGKYAGAGVSLEARPGDPGDGPGFGIRQRSFEGGES